MKNANRYEHIFFLISQIISASQSFSFSFSRPRLCKFQPSEGSASCLPEMTSFTFPDIFKRFSNTELRTTRNSTLLFSRSWIIARSIFHVSSNKRIVNRTWKKFSRIFHCFFPWIICQFVSKYYKKIYSYSRCLCSCRVCAKWLLWI